MRTLWEALLGAAKKKSAAVHDSQGHPVTDEVLETDMTYRIVRSFALILPISLASGCVIMPGDGGDDDRLEIEEEEEGLRLACDASVSVEFEAEAEVLVEAFRTSLSEMISCGRLTSDLAGGVQTGIASAIIDNRPDATPEGWTYAGKGLFTTAGGQASMQTQFYLGRDFAFGAAGDPVDHNVFRVDTYLEGARVSVPDPLSFQAEIHFDQPGPLAEMLGFGAEPSSPITVDLQTLGSIGNRLSALHFESDIQVEEASGSETIRYDLHTERMEANALLLGAPLRYEMDTLVARTDSTDLEVDDWSAEFFSGGQVEGSTSFEVTIDAQWSCEGTIVFPELPRPSGD